MENGNGAREQWVNTWRVGYPIRFPSGNVAYIRPVSISALIAHKNVPQPLLAVVQAWIDGPTGGNSENLTEAEIEERMGGRVAIYRQQRQLYEAYAYAAMIKPRVVDEPKADDEISPEDIDQEDLEFLYNFLGRTAAQLKEFSQFQQTAGMESVLDVKGFFDDSKSDSGGEPPVPTTDGDGGRSDSDVAV